MNNIIQCIKISKFYQNGDVFVPVLNKISFKLNRGTIAAIIGHSGSGKTTLLHLIAALDNPSSGNILFNGTSIQSMSSNQIAHFRNQDLGLIYQFHHLMLDFNVLENVAMPLLIGKKRKKESEEIAYNMLKEVNLEHKRYKYPSEISGGERQRVAIARAFVNKPLLIIGDEPTNNLDQYNVSVIIDLILKFNEYYNTSFLIVTHDIRVIKQIPVIFKMHNGQLFNYKNE
ncbi:lipoprotein-releasing ABC transporter ATP-binding protein LolD [Buchnera aphidicola (Hyadaphis tataricae)]|uniref:Lipoprotein-releasing system ATP-binding protein LolD n=1 Tax=Buchnera aphidicola (Hyadaphis tataricae) TaxID=1241859 RepID=A0A4D6XVW8_9GAMM|nr:lipoprotein-releasing ABC transporter ATP-binding protein LolD [Buchnera aphidicola]QCI21596.1 lipoprotein-releasing ABC transporter ATP-binding protein LolD [Buchnera aphidicola (Hyadaphis tataricae)]